VSLTDDQLRAAARLERALLRVANELADADPAVRRVLAPIVDVVV
jgi:hypothetical protein